MCDIYIYVYICCEICMFIYTYIYMFIYIYVYICYEIQRNISIDTIATAHSGAGGLTMHVPGIMAFVLWMWSELRKWLANAFIHTVVLKQMTHIIKNSI